MKTFAVHLKEEYTQSQIDQFVDMVQSLDFVASVEQITDEGAIQQESLPANYYLLYEQITQLYPNEWVLLANIVEQKGHIVGGEVILHEKDKRIFTVKAKDLIPQHQHTAHFYIGDWSKRATSGLLHAKTH
jgi:hypothetical protein